MIYKADLHIHSCLSPCGSLDMSPRAIVERALETGLNCVALTDHNSAGNCGAVARLCERNGLLFFPGLEVTTAEEAHIVCLFDNVGAAEELGRMVYDTMPPVKNKPEKFGDQVIVNEDDEIEGEVEKYLVAACGYTIDTLRDAVASLGGLFIAAHVDKPCFSVTSQLGVLSGEFDAVELSRAGAMRAAVNSATGTAGIRPPVSSAATVPVETAPHGNVNRPYCTVEITQETIRAGLRALVGDYAVTSASDSHYLHTLGSARVEFKSDGGVGLACLKQALHDKLVRLVIFDRAFRTAPGQRAQT